MLGFEGLITAFNPLRNGLVLRENNKKAKDYFRKKMEKKNKTCLTDFQILMKRYFFVFLIMNH